MRTASFVRPPDATGGIGRCIIPNEEQVMANETLTSAWAGDEETGRDGAALQGDAARARTARATERAHQMVDRVGAGLHTAAESLGNAAESAISQRVAAAAAARRHLHERPFVVLGAAFALGFVLSRLMR